MKSYQLIIRVSLLRNVCLLIEDVKEKIRYSCEDIPTMLSAFSKSERYKNLWFINNLAEICANGVWKTDDVYSAICSGKQVNKLKDTDLKVITSFAEGLGKSDVEGQLNHCRLYKSMMERNLADARSDSYEKGRLYSMLGLLAGIAFVIFLI